MLFRSILSAAVIATCLFADKPSDPGNSPQAKPTASIQWLTSEADIDKALLTMGKATVQFQSAVDLQNITVWLTPSLSDLTAKPDQFASIATNKTYTITLTLPKLPDHTMGGTLHLRGEDSRTYAAPLALNVQVAGGAPQKNATVAAVVGAANYQTGSVAPGQIVSIFGSGIGPESTVTLELDADGKVAKYLGETVVLFNGMPAPLLAASSSQVNAVVPQGIADDATVDVVVSFRGSVSPTVTLPVTPANPALFTLDGSGHGAGAILNQDGTVNGATQPALRETIVTLFGSGFGRWKQSIPDGTLIGTDLPTISAPVSVTIDDVAATVRYAGGAGGLVSGVVQINVEVPAGIQPGEKTIVVTVGGQSSPANVTITVK